MTDLIASLAESIVALINAKPQSPTKDEVEAVVREHVEQSVMRIKADADVLASHPVMHIAPGHVVWSAQNDFTDWTPDPTAGSCIMPVPHKDPSPELMKLMERNTQALKDAMNTSVYGGPTKEDRDRWMSKIFNEQPLETAHRTGPTFTCDRYGHRVSKPIDVCGKCSCGATKP